MADSVGLRWYATGTVTLTANSTAVAGTGTNWKDAGLKPGDIFTVDRNIFYEIASVNSNTSITLAQAWAGSTGSSINYFVIRNFAATLQSELAAEITRQNAIYQTWMDGRITEVAIPYDYSSQYKIVWASGRAYKALDIVMYNNALYVCTVAHTSSSSITPTNINYWTSYAPAMPASIDVLNYHNSGAHNSLYRGKNLGSTFTSAQATAISNGTFTDLYIGDYWTVSNLSHTYLDADGVSHTETYSGTLRIADINYYLRAGEGNNDFKLNHIVVVPDTSMYSHCMNDTNTTAGGYVESKMYISGLNKAKAIFKAFFGESHISAHREYLVNAVANGRPAGGAWLDSTVEIMDERQVYGSLIFDSGNPDGTNVPNRYSVSCKQFNLFRYRPDLISNRQWYWLRNVVAAAWFANVTDTGGCIYGNASAVAGVRPAALVA